MSREEPWINQHIRVAWEDGAKAGWAGGLGGRGAFVSKASRHNNLIVKKVKS